MSSNGSSVTGYLHFDYVASLQGRACVRALPHSGGWMVERPITGTIDRDLMGSYPLFCCVDWRCLSQDLAALRDKYVSAVVVSDPFGKYDEALLKDIFQDHVCAYKEHYIVDLECFSIGSIGKHHQRNIRQSERSISVSEVQNPAEYAETWILLYRELVQKHNITGPANFGAESLRQQLKVPGLKTYSAMYNDQVVGMILWYLVGNVAYYHLAAYNHEGYERRASFALFAHCLQVMSAYGVRYFALGAGAGTFEDKSSGLDRFKRGWSTGTRQTYICGKILNPERYRELLSNSQRRLPAPQLRFFPSYRDQIPLTR